MVDRRQFSVDIEEYLRQQGVTCGYAMFRKRAVEIARGMGFPADAPLTVRHPAFLRAIEEMKTVTDQPAKPKTLGNTAALTVRFFLRHGAMVEWPVPAGQPFALPALVHGIRGSGFFIADDLYIPHEEIACIGLSGAASRVVQPQHARMQ